MHSASGYTWIGSAYVLATAAAGPVLAKLSDIWGRKLILLGSIAGFGLASVMAAASRTMATLIAARAIQGASAGGIGQLVSITISDLFSLRQRALYMGGTGIMWTVAGAAGPLVGGAFTQLVSWRWCFWINVPVSAVAFVGLFACLDVHNPRTKLWPGLVAVDWFGTLSVLAVTLLLLLGLDFGGAIYPWNSPKVICLLVFGTFAIGLFLWSEKRLAKYPLMPLGIFNSATNNATFAVALLHSMVMIGAEYYLPLYFQSAKEASPLRSGILLIPMMVAASVGQMLVGILTHRTGRYREFIWVGTTIMTLGTGLYISIKVDTPVAQVLGFEVLATAGIACIYDAPDLAILNAVSQADTATATATLGSLRNIGTALSIVLGAAVFQNGMAKRQTMLAAAGLDAGLLRAFSADMAASNVLRIPEIAVGPQRSAVKDAFSSSISDMFIMYTALAGLSIAASVFIRHRKLRTHHEETRTGIPNMTKRHNGETLND